MQKFTGKYFTQAWADLSQDKRWWQPILLLTLVQIIPVIGQIIALGYIFDWAKEASWGLNRPFPRQMGDVGKRIKYGFFGYIVILVWVLPITLVASLLSAIPFLGQIIYFVGMVLMVVAGVISNAAVLRSLTYERIAPGLQFKRIINMARQDTNGLVHCWLISFVGGLIIGIVACIVLVPVLMAAVAAGVSATPALEMGEHGYMYGGTMSYSSLYPLLALLAGALPLVMVLGFVFSFFGTVVSALSYRAYGYWLGQFMPSKWGRADDPMPFEVLTGSYTNPFAGQTSGPQQAGAAAAAAGAEQAEAQQAQNEELYEEARRATDPGARAQEWEREFVASQQVEQRPALEGEATSQVEEKTPAVEEAVAEAVASEEPVAVDDSVEAGTVKAEEPEVEATDANPAPEEPVQTADVSQSEPAGWRSASNAAVEPQPETGEGTATVSAEKQIGWRSASNGGD